MSIRSKSRLKIGFCRMTVSVPSIRVTFLPLLGPRAATILFDGKGVSSLPSEAVASDMPIFPATGASDASVASVIEVWLSAWVRTLLFGATSAIRPDRFFPGLPAFFPSPEKKSKAATPTAIAALEHAATSKSRMALRLLTCSACAAEPCTSFSGTISEALSDLNASDREDASISVV